MSAFVPVGIFEPGCVAIVKYKPGYYGLQT